MPALAGTAHTVEDIGPFVSLFGGVDVDLVFGHVFGHVDYTDHNPVVLLCPLDHITSTWHLGDQECETNTSSGGYREFTA